MQAEDPGDRPREARRGEGQSLGPLYLAPFSVSANEKLALSLLKVAGGNVEEK